MSGRDKTPKFLDTHTFITTLDPHHSKSHSASGNRQTELTPEQYMWRAVVAQALSDAASNSYKPEARYHRRQAIAWLTGMSEDFITVCELAGLDPKFIREKAMTALENAHASRSTILQHHHRQKKRPRALNTSARMKLRTDAVNQSVSLTVH